MSKQKLFIKHKDDIMIKLTQCQGRSYHDEQVEAKALNHGWIQALKWVLGFDELFKINDKNTDPFDQWNDLNDENEFSNVLPDEPKHEQDKRLYKEGK